MIKQRVVLKATKSKDGYFNYVDAQVGLELWIDVKTFAVRPFKNKETNQFFQALVVDIAEQRGSMIPVELLHFTDDFEVI